MTTCSECHRLREETASLFSDYILRRDELAMARKQDKAYESKRRALERVEGQLNEAHKREQQHRDETHYGYGSPDESLGVSERLSQLREHLALVNEQYVQRLIFELGPIHNGWQSVPNEVVEGLLTILRNSEMFTSPLAGHVLNYFEFESPLLTQHQKQLCKAFLTAHGNSFTDVFSMQVIAELREGNWLT
jgi:hypothetical protein